MPLALIGGALFFLYLLGRGGNGESPVIKGPTHNVAAGSIWTLTFSHAGGPLDAEAWRTLQDHLMAAGILVMTTGQTNGNYTVTLRFTQPYVVPGAGATWESPIGPVKVLYAQPAPAA